MAMEVLPQELQVGLSFKNQPMKYKKIIIYIHTYMHTYNVYIHTHICIHIHIYIHTYHISISINAQIK